MPWKKTNQASLSRLHYKMVSLREWFFNPLRNETVLAVDSQAYREEVMGMGLCLMIRLRRSTTAEIAIIPRSLKAPKRTDSITSLHPLCPTLLLSSKGYQKEIGAAVSRASARI